VFYSNLNCSKTNGRNNRTHVVSCSLTDQGLTWLFAIGCKTTRLKHATLLAKLPINPDNTSWSVAWMKCKGAAFLQTSTNSDETFLRGLFAWSIAEPNRNILGQDMINPKRTTQWSVTQQRNVSHSTVGTVASGYARPGRRDSILKCTASHCQRSTQTLLISHLLVSESKYKKSLAGKPLLVTKQPWWFCVKSGVDSSSIVSLESRIWQMDIYEVQWASTGPPREIFLGGTKPIWGL